MARRRGAAGALLFAIGLALALWRSFTHQGQSDTPLRPTGSRPAPTASHPRGPASAGTSQGDSTVAAARAAHAAGAWVEDHGTVSKLLRDDNDGARHQRFLLRTADGGTVLIAHNLDLAPRAVVEVGAEVELRGRFEWNDRGGVVHWTHHDPDGSDGGWLRVAGETYR